MSPTFYLAYRGSTWHAEGDCRLKARHLYRVKKLSKHVFGFDPIWPEGSEVIKCSKNFGLTDRSFGFISCAQDEKQASEAAKEWLDSLPFAYTWELVWAGVGVGVLLLVVMVVVLIIRHKRMHQASLRVT
ncbi:uncharacterized protein LOC123516180 [Portunus trituberculatus]|uniref:uncharacterized protein LOC123516180 n=1 Tax=Portunus trituberculatus TaxID=210409 RepID=UPI001E1CDED4|nr:uncharacterized protein LOC123516180 [Portunus trituberculatus]